MCSGNTCRSPLALAAWRALPCPPLGVEANSAGLSATSGTSASRSVLEIAHDWNVDLQSHRARPLNERMLLDSDLICAMTPDHVRSIIARGARLGLDFEGRVALLGSFAEANDENSRQLHSILHGIGGAAEIEATETTILDPFGGSREAYQSCAAQIQRAVVGLSRAIAAGRFKDC